MSPHLSILPTYPSPFNFASTPLIPASPSLPLSTRKHARTNTLDILTLPACDPKRSRTNPSALAHGDDPLRLYIPAHHLVQPLPTVARPSLSPSTSSSSSSSSDGESGQGDSEGDGESTLQDEGEEGLDEGDSTSSSSSSSSSSSAEDEEDEEDDSEDTDTDSHSHSSSIPHPVPPNPAIPPNHPSTLHTRLSAFLPSLRAANQALETERLAGTLDARNIENVEEEEGEGGQYIEMDLGLGVLEEKRDGDDDISSDESWSEIDSPEEQEKDILGRLMGIRKRKRETKPGIEVVGGGAS